MTELFVLHEVQTSGRAIGSIARPTTVHDALELLAADPVARPLAGGTDLLLDLQRGGPGEPVPVVDLTGIEGFRSISEEEDAFVLAGGVTLNQVVRHTGIREAALPLAQACVEVGSPQLRNRATIAGNLVTASPANDTISALMALDAWVEVGRHDGTGVVGRSVPVVELFDGFRSTVLAPGELITAIRVPKLALDERGIWVKLGLRRAQAISVVHAGIVVGLAEGVVTRARLALGSVAPTVVMIDEFADTLMARPLDSATIRAAARAVSEAVSPIDDVRATADYRRAAIVMLVERALRTLATGDEGRMWLDDPPTLSAEDQLHRAAPVARPVVSDTVTAVVNGETLTGGRPELSLLDWIRDEAASGAAGTLSGVKEGCAEGECGACTVVMDGAAVMSCLVTAGQADGSEIVTIEGLAAGDELHPVQQSFIDEFAVQCGFCIPGFVVAGARLLEENPEPNDDQIRLALSGNLCRCTGYYPIMDAIRRAGR